MRAPDSGRAAVRRHLVVNLGACLLLLVQYLVGMVVNEYVTLPDRHPGAGATEYFSGVVAGLAWLVGDGPRWASVHAALGVALAAGGLVTIALTWRDGSAASRTASVVGALAIIGAGFNGASFVNYGHEFSSLIMAGLWAVSLACYVIGAVLAAGRTGTRSSRPE